MLYSVRPKSQTSLISLHTIRACLSSTLLQAIGCHSVFEKTRQYDATPGGELLKQTRNYLQTKHLLFVPNRKRFTFSCVSFFELLDSSIKRRVNFKHDYAKIIFI